MADSRVEKMQAQGRMGIMCMHACRVAGRLEWSNVGERVMVRWMRRHEKAREGERGGEKGGAGARSRIALLAHQRAPSGVGPWAMASHRSPTGAQRSGAQPMTLCRRGIQWGFGSMCG